MQKSLLLSILVILVQLFSFGQSDIIISQYTETNSGTVPKGIEIVNISGGDITFNGTTNLLEVFVGVNGGAFASVATVASGTFSADDAWVIGTTGLTNLNTLEAFTFNGDDAIKIELGGVVQDVFGDPGSDPGSSWSGSGISTANQNIQLKDGICDGDTDGWTDPSTRFELVSANPSADETGFGVAPNSCTAVKTEPTNNPTAFATGAVTTTTIPLSWTNSVAGASEPDGYIIKWKTSAGLTDPIDGTAEANGALIQNITNGTGAYIATGLSSATTYHFEIWPYTNSGTDINYKTDAVAIIVNETTATTTIVTDFFRSAGTGDWNTTATWESSPDGAIWITSTLVPTSIATSITILTGHTITINADATALDIAIEGTGVLTFDGAASRDIAISGNVTIANGASFISQGAGIFTNTISIGGNLTNNGTFDMSRGGTTLVGTVTFNKDGNQTISGTGATTRFSYIIVDLGATNANILEISSADFQASANFLHESSGSVNGLQNGTIKFSGTYALTNEFFQIGTKYNVVSTAGFWINNPNVTFTAIGDSYEISGLLRVTDGTLNVGINSGNSLKYKIGSTIIIEGGILNVAGRFSGTSVGQTTTLTISGGIINLVQVGSGTSSSKFAGFMLSAGSTFVWSDGTIVFEQGQSFYGGYDYSDESGTATITGGTLQIANASSADVFEYYIYSVNPIPSLHLTNNNTPFVYLFNNTPIIGNLTIEANCELETRADPNAHAYEVANPGTTVYSATDDFNISVTGDFSNSGTFTRNDRKVTFNGNISQSIEGAVSTTFYDLEINNTAGVIVNKSATIDNSSIFTNGDFTCTATNYLSFDENAISSSQSTNSHVIGTIEKLTNSTTAFTFPTGNGTKYRSIGITPSNTSSTTWTAEYKDTGHTDRTVTGSVNHVSNIEYWNLDRAGGTPANAEIVLSWDSESDADANFSELVVAHYNGTDWETAGGNGHTGNATAGTVTSNTNWSSFSPFALGSTTNNNPLPIDLLSFTGQLIDNNTHLKWSTSSEINNDYFNIERSSNSIDFYPIDNIMGAGNSSTVLNYSTIDYAVIKNMKNYYRLKQVDFDGEYTYSNIVSINPKSDKISELDIKFINTREAWVNSSSELQNIQVINTVGQVVKTINVSKKSSYININELPMGIYIIKVKNFDSTKTFKVRL